MSLFAPDQVIIVTGASSGIGLACARECVKQGASVIANARNHERLENAKENCLAPERWHNEPLDLVKEIENLPQWLAGLRQKFGRFWGLLHCAGQSRIDSIMGFDLAEARQHLEMNFFAPLQLAKGFSDRRNYQKGACMIFLASIAAIYPEKGLLLYASGKAALVAAIKSLSQELASRDLRANCISPASIRTPMLESALLNMGASWLAREEARYPLGFGDPQDVANLACFLLSDKAGWITGQNFPLTGGAF